VKNGTSPDIVERLDAVNLPVGRTLKKEVTELQVMAGAQ